MALGAPAAFAYQPARIGEASRGEIVGGYKLFQANSCGDCHSMRAAGSTAYAQLGMNFNHIHAPYHVAVAVITNGLPAGYPIYPTYMPHYGRVLTASQIRDLAAFIAEYSGGYRTCAECPTASTSP
jgi:mono/diheme cytochrome c family protein